jgi:hypothetical protein
MADSALASFLIGLVHLVRLNIKHASRFSDVESSAEIKLFRTGDCIISFIHLMPVAPPGA